MNTAVLHSVNAGELLAASLEVSPKLLEEVLEVLASAPFPINPDLDHSHTGKSRISFPLYEAQVSELRELLARAGFSPDHLVTQPMVAELQTVH